MLELHVAGFADLDRTVGYDIWALRVAVFVVEQQCPYLELDGRDREPATRHVWATEDGAVVGCLRMLVESSGQIRIGRVCVRKDVRGAGVAALLMRSALLEAEGLVPALGGAPPDVVLDAQSHVARWYEKLGFAVCGSEFMEDGIPHVPMLRRSR